MEREEFIELIFIYLLTSPPPDFESQTVQHIASRYAHYAILAAFICPCSNDEVLLHRVTFALMT
jgi:hypothetical protein